MLTFAEMEGKNIAFRARVHTLRRMSARLVFIVFRQQTITIQGVLQSFKAKNELLGMQITRLGFPANIFAEGEDNEGSISEQMVRSVEHYPSETIVVVIAKVKKAPKRVKNATIHEHELEVYEVHKVGNLTENVPFTVYDAENINRDKEEVEDGDEDDSLYPSNGDTPRESGKNSPKVGTPRTSTDLSRFSVDSKARNSKDNFASRSKCISLREEFLPTPNRQHGRLQTTTISSPKSPSQQSYCRPSNCTRSSYLPNPVRDLQPVPLIPRYQRLH